MLKRAVFILLSSLFFLPSFASALEVSGWVPYWRNATGTADAVAHLDRLTEINPFVYTLKKDGTIVDNGKMQQDPWLSAVKAAQAKGVKVVPTVMASDGDTIHALLKSSKTRLKLEDDIAALVKKNGFDGIDIDFEGKKIETKKYYSLLLQGTKMRLGNKMLSCTIESRTPPAILYRKIPADIEYVNDFAVINKYCDRVKFMTYDQNQAIYALNEKNFKSLYSPVSDPEWVELAIKFAMQKIDKKKIMIGIPTYGYEYDITGAIGVYDYDLLWSFNPGWATQMSTLFGRPIERGVSGEPYLTYVPTSTASLAKVLPPDVFAAKPVPVVEGAAPEVVKDPSGQPIVGSFRYLTWSDAQAIKQKVDLATRLGVRGVAIFKIDGGEDPNMWSILPKQR